MKTYHKKTFLIFNDVKIIMYEKCKVDESVKNATVQNEFYKVNGIVWYWLKTATSIEYEMKHIKAFGILKREDQMTQFMVVKAVEKAIVFNFKFGKNNYHVLFYRVPINNQY